MRLFEEIFITMAGIEVDSKSIESYILGSMHMGGIDCIRENSESPRAEKNETMPITEPITIDCIRMLLSEQTKALQENMKEESASIIAEFHVKINQMDDKIDGYYAIVQDQIDRLQSVVENILNR